MREKTWHEAYVESRTWGAKLADGVAAGMGSWTFIIVQTFLVVVWLALNLVGWMQHWDPFPFILLNLVFAAQASYAAPIIMQSQNRQTERDRHQADADYRTNVEAKKEIEELQKRLARIEDDKLERILKILEKK
jgi:uncharacterized membrane protein